jgi:hypothetical protein
MQDYVHAVDQEMLYASKDVQEHGCLDARMCLQVEIYLESAHAFGRNDQDLHGAVFYPKHLLHVSPSTYERASTQAQNHAHTFVLSALNRAFSAPKI